MFQLSTKAKIAQSKTDDLVGDADDIGKDHLTYEKLNIILIVTAEIHEKTTENQQLFTRSD